MQRSASGFVKLYLCSNPEDSVLERRTLRENVFPKLREKCRQKHGLDFRVIDPFESPDSSLWPDEVCRRQLITECRETSAGPFLLVLVGHRYGSADLPPHLEVTDFLTLLQQGQRSGVSTEDLERVYERDENFIPPSFRRKTTRRPTQRPQQAAVEEEEELRMKDEDLKKKFQTIIDLCVQNEVISPEKSQRFSRSALDADLRFALDEPDDDVIKRCLVYVHKVINAKGERDTRQSEASDIRTDGHLLSVICDDFLPGLIVSHRLRVYTVTTDCDRRHGYTTTRRRSFTQSLCQQLISDLLGLIQSFNVTEKDPKLRDALAREQAEQQEISDVIARLYDITRPEEEKVRVYLQSEQRLPLVVSGETCTGKTVLLAHCTNQIRSWLPDRDPVVISYFFDLSINPSPTHLLLSLIYQINKYQTSESNPSNTPRSDCFLASNMSLAELKDRFSSIISSLPSTEKPLILILDGLDQMRNNFGPHILMEILPSPFPPSVRVVLSASSRRTQTISPGRCVFLGSDRESVCVQLDSVERKQCVRMLEELLRSSGRKVTSGQQAVVNRALTSCPLILYTRLLHLHTSLWHSDSEVSDSSLPDSVHSSISMLLDHLEEKHGSSIVTRSVSYVTLSRSGVTEAELVDLLSNDPKVQDQIRSPNVPEVAVETLLLDLRKFLISRTVAGSRVLFWVSRHFKLVVAKRCLGTPVAKREIHSAMADYFSGRLSPNQEDNSQPFVFESSGSVNFRKILELPYHLQESGRWEELERGMLMSFNFQQAMVQAGLLGDLVVMLESEDGPSCLSRERSLVANTLKSRACLLQRSPLQLPSVLETNIRPYLEVFPALEEYFTEIRQERRSTGSGLGVLLCPAPSSVPPIRCVKLNAELAEEVSVIEAAGTECGIVAQVMDDGTAWIWKSPKCELEKLSVSCEQEDLKFVQVKSSGRFVLLSTECNKIFLWDVSGPEMFQKFEDTSQRTVEGFAACQRKLFIWWKEESFVSVFDVSTLSLTRLQCQSCVTCLVCSSNGVYMFCGQEDGTVSIFNTNTSVLLSTCSNSYAISSMILCEEKCEVACVDRTGNLTVWDVASKRNPPRLVTENLSGSKSRILNVDHSREFGTLLACQSHHVALWDTCDWELWAEFSAPKGKAFTQAVLSQDGHLFLALLDTCPLVFVWRVSSGECVLSLETKNRPCALLKSTSDIVCVAGDGRLTLWDSGMIDAAGSAPKMGHGVKELVVEQSEGHFYTSDGSDMVWRWSLETGFPIENFLHDGPVEKMRLSPKNGDLVTLSAGEIYIWQTEMGQNVLRLSGSDATDVLIAPNGNFGVSLSERALSRVWKLASGNIVCNIHLALSDAQVSSESTFLIGRWRGDLLAASLWSGLISKRFSGAESSEEVVAFHALSAHPDFVVVMGVSGAVYTWNVAAGTLCRHFLLPYGFHCQPKDFQTSSDGSYILLSTRNQTIDLLDLSRVRLFSFKADGPIVEACLDGNGRFAVYVSQSLEKHGGSEFVLAVRRLADGEITGSVCLDKTPVTLVVCDFVFVGFEDGSVGVYSILDGTVEGAESSKCRADLKQCPFDRATRRLPLATPNITWS